MGCRASKAEPAHPTTRTSNKSEKVGVKVRTHDLENESSKHKEPNEASECQETLEIKSKHKSGSQSFQNKVTENVSCKEFVEKVSGEISEQPPEKITQSEQNEAKLTEEFPDDPFNGETIPFPEREEDDVHLPGGCVYRGGWDKCLQHGIGLMKFPDGGSYLGHFVMGKAEGKGIYTAKDGCTYKGSFKKGKANGYGVYTFRDGSKYWGYFVDDVREGRGKESQADGLTYIGEYSKGHKHGKGMLIAQNGELYEGDFRNSDIDGFGTYKWPDGRVYIGEWKKSKQNGKAIFKWPDGRVYKGQYKEGKINGFGILDWPDGRRYEGHWENGCQHGIGYYWSTKSTCRKAQFANGCRIKWLKDPEEALWEPLGENPLIGVQARQA